MIMEPEGLDSRILVTLGKIVETALNAVPPWQRLLVLIVAVGFLAFLCVWTTTPTLACVLLFALLLILGALEVVLRYGELRLKYKAREEEALKSALRETVLELQQERRKRSS
jgi:hypothetical protein